MNERQDVQIERSAGRLGERLARLEEKTDRNGEDIQALRTDVDALKRFQAWIFGIGTGLGAAGALLANGIKEWLKA